MTFTNILASTVAVFMIMGVGCLARRTQMITDDSEKGLMRLVITILLPCFILSKVPGNPALQDPSVVALALGVGIATVVLAFIICYWVGKLCGITQQLGLNTFALATALQNYGFIPIPIIESIFPEAQGNQILGVLFVHNLGIETALWTAGIVALSGSSSGAWKRLINPPSVAITAGLILNATGLYLYFPEFLVRVIRLLGMCTIPMALILVGATLLGVIEREKWKTDYRAVGLAVLLRFSVLPLLLIGFAFVIGALELSPELKTVLLIQAAMPCATFPMLLAKHYGGQPRVAMQVCLVTSAVSLILTPVLMTCWFWLLESPAV